MQIEDEQPSTLSLHELLADKQNRVKVIRIVYQALKSMGYTQTALELLTESDIKPEEETESIIKSLFEQKQYQKVTGIVEQLHIQSSKKAAVSCILAELQIMQLIQEKQYQAAIQRVMSVWPQDQEKQLVFLSMIATGQPISPEQFQNRHNQVLQHCITESFQLQNNIKKLLKGYLSASVFDKRSLSEEQPFKKIVAESDKLQGMGKPSFLKLHPKADSICMISQSSRQTHVSIWSINGSKISLKLQWKQEHFGSIGSVCWDGQGNLLAFNSTTKLAICDTLYQLKPIVILESHKLLKAKLLCCRWDSKGLLFVGGMAEAITAIDNHGKIVRTIRPFMKTRDMVFNSKDELYVISATNGIVVKYDLSEEKVINSFKANNCFMDLYLNEQAQTLVVTNQQYIHLLDPVTLEEKMNVLSPHNERLYKIEAFFTQNWLFVYNQKLTAVLQNHLVTRHHIWPDCDAVDVRGNKMVTAKTTLMIWQPEDTAVESIQSTLNNRDNSQDIEWYSQVLEQDLDQQLQEMHSLSSNSDSQEVEEESESQDQQNPIQIEYLENQSDESEESDPEQA